MRFLFFSPYQAIEKHSFPESFMAEILEGAGHDVSFMGCNGTLKDFCISHSAYGLTEAAPLSEKLAVCSVCIKNRKQVSKKVGSFYLLENYYLDEYSSEIEEKISRLKISEIYDSEFRGYSVGQLASYEFILAHKLSNMANMTEAQFGHFKYYYRNVLRSVVSFEKFFSEQKIDKVLVYNSGYSINSTIVEVAKKFGIPSMFMQAGLNLKHMVDSMYFSHDNIIDYNINSIRYFLDNRERLNFDFSKYFLPLDHVATCYNAKSVFTYSSARNPSSFVQLKNKLYRGKSFRKVALLTMSSGDETYAADFAVAKFEYVRNATRVFHDPFIWVRETIAHFRGIPDCLLLIRIHPREFPNKRENATSSRVKEYEKLFESLPDNVIIDHPSDGNSLYDIFEFIDFQIAAQSTAGVEGTLMGIPLISTVTRMGMYPIPCLADCPKTTAEYFGSIDRMIAKDERPSRELMFRSLQWYLFLHHELQFNFSTADFWGRMENRNFFLRAYRKLRRALGIPRYSVRNYFRNLGMEERNRKDMVSLLTTRAPESEVYHIREESMLGRVNDPREVEANFQKFVLGLGSLYYRKDFSRFERFQILTENSLGQAFGRSCAFIFSDLHAEIEERKLESSSVFYLPKEAKFARAFASLVTTFSKL